jgi:hypothetical protein
VRGGGAAIGMDCSLILASIKLIIDGAPLVIHDALQLPDVRDAPVAVACKATLLPYLVAIVVAGARDGLILRTALIQAEKKIGEQRAVRGGPDAVRVGIDAAPGGMRCSRSAHYDLPEPAPYMLDRPLPTSAPRSARCSDRLLCHGCL